MKKIKFYDTSSVLIKGEALFEEEFIISSISFEELENIKTSYYKDEYTKMQARKITRLLDENTEKYKIEFFTNKNDKILKKMNYPISNDIKILSCALAYSKKHKDIELEFITNDLCLKNIAKLFLPKVDSVVEEKDDYLGFKEVVLNNEEMDYFYSNQDKNIYNLLINEYLIIKTEDGDIIDRLCWTDEGYRQLNYTGFYSHLFGNVKPKRKDPYQAMFCDSLINNKITMIKGPAGSGKTYLALAYLAHCLEKEKIDHLIIFCNTIATRDSAKLGYYPGTRDEKLLDSQIGNLLASKLGSKEKVEELIADGKLFLLPMSDIRGYDTSGMKAGVYISEAQNMSIDLMKLALQRIGEDSICIIDGDFNAQVDDENFAGHRNGMRKLSKVFRGEDIYGEVTLQHIYRSQIGKIAENM